MTENSRVATSTPSMLGLRERWERLEFHVRFILVASIVLLGTMAIVTSVTTAMITRTATEAAAHLTAGFARANVEPLVQELAYAEALSRARAAELDELLKTEHFGSQVHALKIWAEGDRIVYAPQHELIGQTFPGTDTRRRAWDGEVAADYNVLDESDGPHGQIEDLPVLEVYAPLRETGTGRIIAVAEYYVVATDLARNLTRTDLQTWLAIAVATAGIVALLGEVVYRRKRIVARQRAVMTRRVDHLSRLLSVNETLRTQLQQAADAAAEINERYLHRLSADLHDGPAQFLAYALLRLDAIQTRLAGVRDLPPEHADLHSLRESLSAAMTEIRSICSGMALPNLSDRTPKQMLESAARAHEIQTGTEVTTDIESAPASLPGPTKICIYRFVQETLSNAFRHAGGTGQRLACRLDGDVCEIKVADSGPGFTPGTVSDPTRGLGLSGLEERVKALGGSLLIDSAPGKGTCISMRFTVKGGSSQGA